MILAITRRRISKHSKTSFVGIGSKEQVFFLDARTKSRTSSRDNKSNLERGSSIDCGVIGVNSADLWYMIIEVRTDISLRASSPVGSPRDLFWARFGREPREDWGGGEVRRACRHDWRIFISTPETKFHRKFKIWQELVNQTAQAVRNQHGRQAVGCLYFRSCEEISGHSKRSVPTERTASYISERFALKSWRFTVLLPTGYGKSLIF